MKIFSQLFLLIVFPFFQNILIAQNLELISGKKHKTIMAGTYLEIGISEAGQQPCDDCPGKIMSGRLIKYEKDVLTLEVKRIGDRPEGDSTAHYYTDQVFDSHYKLPIMEVKKNEVTSLIIKGKNKSKKYSTGENIGYLIAIIGIGHLVSAPIAEGETGLLIGLGLAELGAGLILASTSEQPKFIIDPNCPDEQLQAKNSWKIK